MTPFNLWPKESIRKMAELLRKVIEQEESK